MTYLFLSIFDVVYIPILHRSIWLVIEVKGKGEMIFLFTFHMTSLMYWILRESFAHGRIMQTESFEIHHCNSTGLVTDEIQLVEIHLCMSVVLNTLVNTVEFSRVWRKCLEMQLLTRRWLSRGNLLINDSVTVYSLGLSLLNFLVDMLFVSWYLVMRMLLVNVLLFMRNLTRSSLLYTWISVVWLRWMVLVGSTCCRCKNYKRDD